MKTPVLQSERIAEREANWTVNSAERAVRKPGPWKSLKKNFPRSRTFAPHVSFIMRIIIRRQNILIIYSTRSLKWEGPAPGVLWEQLLMFPTATATLGLEETHCVFGGSVVNQKKKTLLKVTACSQIPITFVQPDPWITPLHQAFKLAFRGQIAIVLAP